MDRGYDFDTVRTICRDHGIIDIDIPARRSRQPSRRRRGLSVPLGPRWTIERTNSWLANYGQLRRNTDRHPHHRHAQLALAITVLLTAKLIDWRDRYSPIR